MSFAKHPTRRGALLLFSAFKFIVACGAVLLADGGAQNEQRADDQHDADDQADKRILHETGDNEAYEAQRRNRYGVGQLG